MKHSAEITISRILKTGVIISSLLVLTGITIFIAHHNSLISPQGGPAYKQYVTSGFRFPHSLSSISSALKNGSGLGIIMLGVLLLIITPIIRVAASILLFMRQRNTPMALVTLFVFCVLVLSFVIGAIVS